MHLHADPDDGPDELGEHHQCWQGRVGRDSQPEEGSDNEEGIGAGPGLGATARRAAPERARWGAPAAAQRDRAAVVASW